jgi:hypothetical protein
MSFIDSTYFVGEIAIPQASSETGLTQAILQYEMEIRNYLLGYKLNSLLEADLQNGVPQSQIYLDLVNGAEFINIFRGKEYTLKWEGLKNASLQSLIAYYVYYKYVERDVTRLYGTGISMAVPSDGNKGWERVSPVNKLCSIWERIRQLYGKIPPEYKKYLQYPIPVDEMHGVYNCDSSAFNFLYANKEDYPDWVFTPLWNINAFGI